MSQLRIYYKKSPAFSLSLLLFVFTNILSAYAQASEPYIEITAADNRWNLGSYLGVLEHNDKNIQIHEVSSLPREKFHYLSNNPQSLSVENADGILWLRLNLVNITDSVVDVTMESLNVSVNSISVFARDNDGWNESKTGNSFEFDRRATSAFSLTLMWTVEPGRQEYFIRIDPARAEPIPLEMFTGMSFFDITVPRTMWGGILIGIALGLALFHLILFFQQRDALYLAFVATIVLGLAYRFYIDGIGQAITPVWLAWNAIAYYVLMGFYLSSVLLFHTYFLKLHEVSRVMHYFTLGWSGIYIIGAVAMFVFGLGFGLLWEISLVMVPLYLLGSSGFRAIQGYSPAQYYFLALAAPISMGFLAAYFSLNDIEPSQTFVWLERCAGVSSLMFFTFGLSDRINILNAEKLAAENRATKADIETRVKSDFFARMSHEIRTPMNGVMGMSQLLEKSNLNKEQSQLNEVIQTSSQTLLTLINDLLDFSKAEVGKLELEHIPFSLNTLAHEIESMFIPQVKETGVPLSINIEKGLTRSVIGDPTRVKQILINLIGNAFKFTKSGEIDCFVSYTQDGFYLFSVTDSGIGVSKSDMESLFEPFRQASSSTAREYGGTGLGLSICMQLTELMDGKIWVESRGERAGSDTELNQDRSKPAWISGTRFCFELPLETEEGILAENGLGSVNLVGMEIGETTNLEMPASIKKLQVLVAEDNTVNQMVIKGMLQDMGHDVHLADNGAEALSMFKDKMNQWDVIFMDCEMPVLNGYDATRGIREIEVAEKLPSIPIVALTAHADASSKQRCLDSGMSAHVTKPIQYAELEKALHEFLESDRGQP